MENRILVVKKSYWSGQPTPFVSEPEELQLKIRGGASYDKLILNKKTFSIRDDESGKYIDEEKVVQVTVEIKPEVLLLHLSDPMKTRKRSDDSKVSPNDDSGLNFDFELKEDEILELATPTLDRGDYYEFSIKRS